MVLDTRPVEGRRGAQVPIRLRHRQWRELLPHRSHPVWTDWGNGVSCCLSVFNLSHHMARTPGTPDFPARHHAMPLLLSSLALIAVLLVVCCAPAGVDSSIDVCMCVGMYVCTCSVLLMLAVPVVAIVVVSYVLRMCMWTCACFWHGCVWQGFEGVWQCVCRYSLIPSVWYIC